MRATIAFLVLGLWACGNGENAGAEEARRQAEQELNSEKVPAALKETVRKYFLSLEESKR